MWLFARATGVEFLIIVYGTLTHELPGPRGLKMGTCDSKRLDTQSADLRAVPFVVCNQQESGTHEAHRHRHFTGISYLIGLHYTGAYMGYPYPRLCSCAVLGALGV